MNATGPRTRIDTRYLVAYRDGEHRIVDRGTLVYEGDRIVFAGPNYDGPADETVDARDKVVAPGFISMHTHMAGSPFDKSLQDDVVNQHLWGTGLYDILMPIRSAATKESERAALRASCLELIHSGVTTAVDLSSNAAGTAQAAKEAGLRVYAGQYVRSSNWATDGYSITYEPVGDAEEARLLDEAIAFIETHAASPDGLIRGYLAPAQVDTCSPDLLRRMSDEAERLDVPMQIHAAQSVAEFREILRRTGKTPIEYLYEVGLLSPRLIIGHCIFVSGHSWLDHTFGKDLDLLAESGATVAHCPTVFARHGQVLETWPGYRRRGVKVALGLDTSPQSMLLEMRLAASLSHVLDRSGNSVTAKDAFDAATLVGAAALRREDIGRLAEGCKADFTVFRTDTLSMAPLRDPIRNIVYSALPTDVHTVVIDGVAVLADGAPTYCNEQDVVRDVQRAADEVWGGLGRYHHCGHDVDRISPPSLPSW